MNKTFDILTFTDLIIRESRSYKACVLLADKCLIIILVLTQQTVLRAY